VAGAHTSGPPRAVIILAVAGLVLLAGALWLMFGRAPAGPKVFTGYVVTDNLYMSAPVAGTVVIVDVARGQRVAAGAPLFRIDPTSLGARADAARAQVGQTEAQLGAAEADLGKARAALAAAEAEAGRAQADLARLLSAQSEKPGSVAGQQVDQARAAAVTAARQRDEAATGVASAQARIAAGQSQVEASRAGLTDARQQVSQLAPVAPADSRVEDVMYQRGEWAQANAAIVSLVPDNQVKVRFYVPQSAVAAFRPGTMVAIACDGCARGMTARVDYVATRPEYTPPVIYSLATRDKLVFLVEAAPSAPRELTPGQPIDVTQAASRAARP